MQANFRVDADVARDLIRIEMGGFFTPDDIARLRDARDVAHRRLTCGPNHHVTLNDLRGMDIQSQDAVAAFRDLLSAPEHRSRRLAFVIGPSLARGQLKRAMCDRDARIFADEEEAQAWLLAA